MTLAFPPQFLVPIISLNNMLVWTSMVTKKHFWRQIFGICEKYKVYYTAFWSQNNIKMAVFGYRELLNIVLGSQKWFYLKCWAKMLKNERHL